MKAYYNTLVDYIKRLEELAYLSKDKDTYIVESAHHIHVKHGDGLNGTDFAVKTPMSSCNAMIFKSRQDAEKQGMDYYLVDGNGKPIHTCITKASDYFQREAFGTKKLLIFIKNQRGE